MYLVTEEANKNIKVSIGVRSTVVATLKDVKTSFGDLTTSLDYLAIECSHIDVIIGEPTMENLQAGIDLGQIKVWFTKEDHTVEFSFFLD